MRTRSLASYMQIKLLQDIVADATAEAVSATAVLITQARADATANGQDPDRAEALVQPVPLRNIDPETPTLEWCGRIAKKHGKGARGKVGKFTGLKEEMLVRVRADPDSAGKRPSSPPGPPGGPP